MRRQLNKCGDNKMKALAKITHFSTKFTSYGHWLITVTLENPNLLLSDDDFYWTFADKDDEPEFVTCKKTTTDSRAIDGYDGFEVCLAKECLNANDINCDLVDFSTLNEVDIDE